MIRGLSALFVVLALASCESDPPAITPPKRVDAGSIRAEAARIEAVTDGELERLEEKSSQAAPAIPDAGQQPAADRAQDAVQKSGVNE